jgi:regulator of protease activity HflC (stomatin/prohibitin superfamily)
MELVSYLVQFLLSFWANLLPFHIVNEFEHGVILRFGKFKKTVEAGLVWKIPFFDNVMLCRNTVTTMGIKNQSLTTEDGIEITIEAIVKYKVSNPKKFLLEVYDADDAINDVAQSKIKEIVNTNTWEQIRKLKDSEIKELVQKESTEWGIKIYYITITDLVRTRCYKLINSN